MLSWNQHPIYTRADGSYVITMRGYPYHVPADLPEFAALWTQVDAWARAHPDQVEPEPGPLPPTLDEARAARLMDIRTAYDAALTATLTMPAADPTPTQISTEQALFASTDPDGLADVLTILGTRRADLEAAVASADTVEQVEAVTVTYPV